MREDTCTGRPCARVAGHCAFTLIELLVVIAIIAVLIAILLPALHSARNEGQAAKCIASLRSIGQGSNMYMDDQGGAKLIPWYQFPAYGGTLASPGGIFGISLFTPWVFGGFKAPVKEPWGGYTTDYQEYPADIRPLNDFTSPGARGDETIELWVCPGDRTHSVGLISQAPEACEAEALSSWQVNGSSYTLNTRWAQGYTLPSGNFTLGDFNPGGFPGRIAKHMDGGEASELIMWCEQGFYSHTQRAGPTTDGIGGGAPPQDKGWHRRWSAWSVGFADGHARYGYFDTRQIYGLGGTIWQPNFQHGL